MIILSGKCGYDVTFELTNEYELILAGTGKMYDYTSIDTVYYDKATKNEQEEYIGYVVPWYNYIDSIKYLTFDDDNTITHIGSRAFWKCKNIVGNLELPSTVKTIGDYAFDGCSGFDGELTLPSSLTKIGAHAFRNCSNFEGSLTLPSTLTYIGKSAFSKCSGFTGGLTIPSTVTSIEPYTFEYCSGFDDELVIPSTVTSIGNGAFNGCTGLTGKITIPSTVTIMGAMAFGKCGADESITVATHDTKIGELSFYCSDKSTPSVVISDTVTSIGYNAFYGCENVYSVMLPDSIEYIGREALKGLAKYSIIYTYLDYESFDGKYDIDKSALAFVNGNGYEFFHYITGMPLTTLNAPVKEGYTFVGWYADESFENGPVYIAVSGVTYYPKFVLYSA